MLSKKNRLPKTEFKKIYKKGKRIYSKYFTLIYYKSLETKEPQIGIVVSTKVAKNAVDRNKVKRRLRNISRETLEKIPQNIQLIILTKPGIVDAKFNELKVQVENVLKRFQ